MEDEKFLHFMKLINPFQNPLIWHRKRKKTTTVLKTILIIKKTEVREFTLLSFKTNYGVLVIKSPTPFFDI